MKNISNLRELNQAFGYHNGLKKIAAQLHRQDENACNYGLTPRQETRVNNLMNLAEEIAQHFDLHAYHQSDPRGGTLYLVESLEKADLNYHDGLYIQ